MANYTLACDSVVVVNPPVPAFKIRIPTPNLVPIERPDVSVLVQNPPRLITKIHPPSNNAVVVLPVPGPAGPALVELFDSLTPPVAPPSVYLRFERDNDGDVQTIYLGTTT